MNMEEAVLCVPSAASLKSFGRGYRSKDFCRKHLLWVKGKSGDELRCQTENGWEVFINADKKYLRTGRSFPLQTSIRIVYEEKYYNDDFESLQIVHTNKPLCLNKPERDSVILLENIRSVACTRRTLQQHNALIRVLLGPASVNRLAKEVESFSQQFRSAQKKGVPITLEEAAFRVEGATLKTFAKEEEMRKKDLLQSVRSEVIVAMLAVFLEYKSFARNLFGSHLRMYPMENQRISNAIEKLKNINMEEVGVPKNFQIFPERAIKMLKGLNKLDTAISKIILIQDVMECLADCIGDANEKKLEKSSNERPPTRKRASSKMFTDALVNLLTDSSPTALQTWNPAQDPPTLKLTHSHQSATSASSLDSKDIIRPKSNAQELGASIVPRNTPQEASEYDIAVSETMSDDIEKRKSPKDTASSKKKMTKAVDEEVKEISCKPKEEENMESKTVREENKKVENREEKKISKASKLSPDQKKELNESEKKGKEAKKPPTPTAPEERAPSPPEQNVAMLSRKSSSQRLSTVGEERKSDVGDILSEKSFPQALSTDDILPLLVFTIIKAAPRNLYTNVHYMQTMRPNAAILPEANKIEFTMATLTAALEIIITQSFREDEKEDNESDVDPLTAFLTERQTNARFFPEESEAENKRSVRRASIKRRPSFRRAQSPGTRPRNQFLSLSSSHLSPLGGYNKSGNSLSFSPSPPRANGRRTLTEGSIHITQVLAAKQSSGSNNVQRGLVVMEGYLFKKGWLAPTFRPRYFMLCLPSPHGHKTPYLLYFLGKNSPRPRGMIPVTAGQVIPLNKDGDISFLLRFHDSSTVLKAKTLESARRWVANLQPLMTRAIQNAVELLQARIRSFEITLQEYDRLMHKIKLLRLKEIRAIDGADLLRQLSARSKKQEAKELSRWALSIALVSELEEEKVEGLQEIAQVLGEHLAEGRITQADYDQIVMNTTQKMFLARGMKTSTSVPKNSVENQKKEGGIRKGSSENPLRISSGKKDTS
eukprot:CAMPEP_0167752438 /NCGR_PEP_ID=MMETSP0110_2-20121227/7140_1 /TAXON_ID=629695 /ORGANISM="Gymnochlora sp., Strain CCMP2014" /LENGTH=998 /DNA_ID=CAMNT_0007638057 /DNA_START=155 /DNA_END=3151 /DNA_ORIENTATION=+